MSESLIQRLFGRYLKRQPAAPEPAPEPDIMDEIAAYARREVSAGFSSYEQMRERIADIFQDDVDETMLDAVVPDLLDKAIVAHRQEQLTWPAITDCDRLDAAFLALEEDGVIARQNYTCCGTCGVAEIWDELIEAADQGRPARGYTFYHIQDTESAAEATAST